MTNGYLVASPSKNVCARFKCFSILLSFSSDIKGERGLYPDKRKGGGDSGEDDGAHPKPPALPSPSSSVVLF